MCESNKGIWNYYGILSFEKETVKVSFKKMFGAVHFIYYINRSIAPRKQIQLIWAIDQQHRTYMSCGEGGLEPVKARSESAA